VVLFTGGEARGRAQFSRVEHAVYGAVPGRYMRVDEVHFPSDDVVVVEAVVLDKARPSFFSPFCAILTIRNGMVVLDRTYLDPPNWPGIASAAVHVTPGGIGAHGK